MIIQTTECRYECNHNLSWWRVVVISTFWGNFKSQSISGLPLHLSEICENNYSIIIIPTLSTQTTRYLRRTSPPPPSPPPPPSSPLTPPLLLVRSANTWPGWKAGVEWLTLLNSALPHSNIRQGETGRSHQLFLLIIKFGFHFENLVAWLVHLLTEKNSWG